MALVLKPGTSLSAKNKNGHVTIEAGEGTFRRYSWEGDTPKGFGTSKAEGKLSARSKRWYGKLGLHAELSARSGVEISRVLAEEAQMHFGTSEEALDWLRGSWFRDKMDVIYTPEGLVVGFVTTPHRWQLNIDVYQIYIKGKAPINLPGGKRNAIETR